MRSGKPARLRSTGSMNGPRSSHRIASGASGTLRSPMPLHVLPDRGLRKGVQADSFPLAIGPNRGELLLAKNRHDPAQRKPRSGRDILMPHEGMQPRASDRESPSADSYIGLRTT